MTDNSEGLESEDRRIPPLNLTEDEADYLWEMLKREIGSEEVWENGDDRVVTSLHTKVKGLVN